MIFTVVIGFGYGNIKEPFGFLNLFPDFWQVGDPERSAVLFDHFHEWNLMEIQFTINHFEFVGWEIKGLGNEVDVLIFHIAEVNRYEGTNIIKECNLKK